MKLNFSRKYKIVRDSYYGFEVRYKSWFLPFWIQCNWTNTHPTIEEARLYVKNNCKKNFVEYID